MKQISVADYAREAKTTASNLRHYIKKFGLMPVSKLDKEFYDYAALRRVYPIYKQLDLYEHHAL
jgi:hypothetical protein